MMALNRCLVCYTDLSHDDDGKEETCPENSSLSDWSKDLESVFILTKLFEIPSERLERYLTELGSPSSWNFVRFCERCGGAVENVKKIYAEILEASRIFTAVKGEIVKSVRRSWQRFGGEKEKCLEEYVSSEVRIVEETRKFICEHEYGPSDDPFQEGDRLARDLCSSLDADRANCFQAQEGVIKFEIKEEYCKHEDDLDDTQTMEQQNVEMDDGEWIVGEAHCPEVNIGQLLLPPNEIIEMVDHPIYQSVPGVAESVIMTKGKVENFSYPQPNFFQKQSNATLPPPLQSETAKGNLQCDHPGCNLVFTKVSSMKVHMKRHMGDKSFECTWPGCNWKFVRRDELTRHYRTHTGEKRFKCDLCSKGFLRFEHLRKHVNSSVHKIQSGFIL